CADVGKIFLQFFLLSYRIVHTLIYSLEKNQIKIRTKKGPKPGCSKNAHFSMLFANGSPRHMGQWSSYFILFIFSLGTSSPASNEDWSKMPVAGVGVKHFKEVPKANRFMYVN